MVLHINVLGSGGARWARVGAQMGLCCTCVEMHVLVKSKHALLWCGDDGNPTSELDWPIIAARGWGGSRKRRARTRCS